MCDMCDIPYVGGFSSSNWKLVWNGEKATGFVVKGCHAD